MIESDFPIYKICSRVFQLDKIDKCNNEKIAAIVDVLDLGGKFVPMVNNNIIDSLCEIIQQSERDISTLNSKIFWKAKIEKIKPIVIQ